MENILHIHILEKKEKKNFQDDVANITHFAFESTFIATTASFQFEQYV